MSQALQRVRRSHQPLTVSGGDRWEQEAESQAATLEPASLAHARLHTDPMAGAAAAELKAEAFTVGQDVFFASHRFAPQTTSGRLLLAHELSHVAQQSHSAPTVMRKPLLPSHEETGSEIASLRLKLVELRERERSESVTLPETKSVEDSIKWRESLLVEMHSTRAEVTFLRGRLRELREKLKVTPPSSEREPITDEIDAHEEALQRGLEAEVTRLEAEITRLTEARDAAIESNPDLDRSIAAAEAELLEDQAELDTMRRVFTPEAAAVVGKKYKKEVSPGISEGCMGAVYKGLEGLYGRPETGAIKKEVKRGAAKYEKKTGKDTYHVDRIMDTLRAHAMTESKVKLRYDRKTKDWVPSPESTLLGKVSLDHPGWYFFGMALSGGYHSIILAVDNAGEGPPQIYWMDQYSKGFTTKTNVTGKLSAKMKEFEPSYGYSETRLWPLLPTPEPVMPEP